MRGMQGQIFTCVDVCIPTKVRGTEAEEEWQEVDWTKLSTGDIRVDADTFMLVFQPALAKPTQSVKALPMGALIRASEVQPDADGRTLVVTTTDTMHQHVRITFQDANQVSNFRQVAEQAETAHQASTKGGHVERDEEAAKTEAKKVAARLEADICAAIQGSVPPLIFTGVQLMGEDPNFEGGGVVILGEGAAVLVDPEDTVNVGSYELRFYSVDDGVDEPIKRFVIGPRATLNRLPTRGEDLDDSAVIFDVRMLPTDRLHTLCFEDEQMAATFARDFRVRQRLMKASLLTAKGASKEMELRGQIECLKRMTLASRLWRLFGLFIAVLLVVVISRFAWYYKEDMRQQKTRAIAEYGQMLIEDAIQAAKVSRGLASNIGAQACKSMLGTVPPSDLQLCLAASDDTDTDAGALTVLRRCVSGTVRR
eukprot:CAMPEP_0203856636 /NCGR_PEP_ID=MMETSP0359-20131031/10290_1 /ASSEMBLY_ACC=CAM_ASM_000338 /TAXON_ID=268821 /ORGANISM="Scrippsiella Hangoei, Strain SHTV-5" /LENGTH=423 /DNA_ID=CAMNT_0050773267 /DNA_START=66 /DNA_END=1337 /DNA_ORIENTATION=-